MERRFFRRETPNRQEGPVPNVVPECEISEAEYEAQVAEVVRIIRDLDDKSRNELLHLIKIVVADYQNGSRSPWSIRQENNLNTLIDDLLGQHGHQLGTQESRLQLYKEIVDRVRK